MCRVHSWSRFDIDLWPQCQILEVFVLSLCPTRNFRVLWHWHTIFGTWVYHHGRRCRVHSWSRYDLDLWPQGQIYRVYYMALCSGQSFFVLWYSHTMFGTWVYYRGTMCHMHSWLQYLKYIFTMNLSWAKSSLLFDIGIQNFGIWLYHHRTTYCVHSWPLYDLDRWPICGWRGYP